MMRIRWLGAQWTSTIRSLALKMKGVPFTPDSNDGFIVDRVRDTSMEARYIEKFSYQEAITDPFGNEEVYDRVSYRQLQFNLYKEFPNIELLNSHRSTHAYISKLLEFSNFSVSIIHLEVNLLDWVEAFRIKLEKNIIVDSIQVGGLELEQGVTAKVLLNRSS